MITPSDLTSIDFSGVVPYISWNPAANGYLTGEPGKEPYRLVAHLASVLKDVSRPMADIGTYMGTSALAMALDPDQTVVTYDVYDWIPTTTETFTVRHRQNVVSKIMDCRCSSEMEGVLAKAPLVCLDIDPHDGKEERQIMRDLEHVGFKGVVVLDDIHLNGDMDRFWNEISVGKKEDVTRLGHWSGTGLVFYDENVYTKLMG